MTDSSGSATAALEPSPAPVAGRITGFLPKRQAVEIHLDGPVPQWVAIGGRALLSTEFTPLDAADALGQQPAAGVEQRLAEMLIGIIADIQNELGFSDAEKECSNGSLEIVEAIRQLKRAAALPTYSLDADPAGIRYRTTSAVLGALAFGSQNTRPPPWGHWLKEFWDIGRADAQRLADAAAPAPSYAADASGDGTIVGPDGHRLSVDEIVAGLNGAPAPVASFQEGVSTWMQQCFIPSLYSNMTERGDRLLEEVLEMLQAHGYDRTRVATLVDYVYARPVGEPAQEVGGVMVTLAGFCWVAGLDMHAAGDAELRRITQPELMEKIRRKQEAKNALHFDTPLPGAAGAPAPGMGEAVAFGYVRQQAIKSAQTDDEITGVMVHFDRPADGVPVYLHAPPAPQGDARIHVAALLRQIDMETCAHEETHRGGAIWTICDSCGQQWADDRGGFQPHQDSEAVKGARAWLDAAIAAQAGQQGSASV
ncbi:hypothetical protein [Pseudoxanthomonas winnipegensis]|uniref:hypothetical protein n=1 Tax=Pseudoxanthomonas winnipegensis TaxID=2480810 RepID=UPI00197D9C87|nr:hypothetical protein [Pseudoxanthomonas winnipegensis]